MLNSSSPSVGRNKSESLIRKQANDPHVFWLDAVPLSYRDFGHIFYTTDWGYTPEISSDGDDRRIFLGFKFSILGFFGVGKFGKCFFCVA